MPSTHCGSEDSSDGKAGELLVQRGATLEVDIGLDQSSRLDDPNAKPSLVLKGLRALIDTGATGNCIDSALAVTLNLPIVDQAIIAGVLNAPEEVNVHLAQIYVHGLEYAAVDRFAAVDLAAGGQSHDLLLGRSFLQQFKMTYDGPAGVVIIAHPADFDVPPSKSGPSPGPKGEPMT